ncbi:MAG TPA: hypothetical protein VFN35_15270 [Ktedonobacteraceae bacterium]|nr:hypothetical protein [Ktedonobacteraceae bacterium]
MASLADITHLFVSSLAQIASAAWTTLDQDTGSAHTFYQTCMSLVGVLEGNWTKAYENKFVQNNGRSELIQAKINDFYSASKSLGPDIEELCTRYDNLSPLVGGGVDDGLGQLNITRFLHEDALEGVLIPERDAFIYGVTLEAVLDQGGTAETISYLLASKQSEIINRLSSIYEQDMHANKENKAFQKDLTASHETAIEAIQALTKRLQKHLAEWADKLYFLVRGYQKAVETASHIDKITLADIDYEIKLNPTAPVIIWQQPDGHLLIAVTGAPGNSEETVMQWIRAYLQDHGMTGKRPSVTLLGFDGGVRIAQQIIGIAYPQLNSGPFFNPFAPVGPPFANHTGDLPFTITQAFFVGQNLKLPSHGNLGKIASGD